MHRTLVVILSLMLSTAVANAELLKLSINDAVRRALDNNGQIKAAAFAVDGAKQGVKSAGSRLLPVISFEETLSVSNSPTNAFMMKLDEGRLTNSDFQTDNLNNPSASHDFKTVLSIRQPLYDPTLTPLKQISTLEARASGLLLEGTRQTIAFRTFQACLELQKATARQGAVEKAVTDARENMRLATVRGTNGVGLKSDELRVRTHLSSVEQQLISAQNNVSLCRMQLAMLAGLPDETTVELTGAVDDTTIPLLTPEFLSESMTNRVEVRQSATEQEKSHTALTLAQSDYLPTVGIFASYQLNGKDVPLAADNDSWSAGVTLKWTIFDGFRRDSERERAIYRQSASREMHDTVARDIRYQIKESYLRREEAGKLREVARNAVQDAEETVRLLSRRYENSLATLTELLDAQTALNQARAVQVDVEAGYTLAGGRILYTTGLFVKEMAK